MRWIIREPSGAVFEADLPWENSTDAENALLSAAQADNAFVVVRGVVRTGPENLLNADSVLTFAPGTIFVPKDSPSD